MIESVVGQFVNPIVKRSITALNWLEFCFPGPGISLCCLVMGVLLLGLPLGAYAATTLEDSARELAQEIAAATSNKESVLVTVRNVSSMGTGEASQVEHAIEAELLAQGIYVQSGATASTRVEITLSENLSGLLWTAEIQEGGSTRDILLAVPRESLGSRQSGGAETTLRAEKFWEGPERILDAAQFRLPSGEQTLALLKPSGLSLTTPNAHSNIELPLDSAHVNLRTLTGRIYRFSSQLTIQLGPNTCAVFLDTAGIQECHSVPVLEDPAPILNHGDQSALIHSACGGAIQILATGTGDFTQPDTIQAFDQQRGAPVPSSNELDFPGPVIALHEFADSPTTGITAIVHNLRNGNYEAYHLSISCGQ